MRLPNLGRPSPQLYPTGTIVARAIFVSIASLHLTLAAQDVAPRLEVAADSSLKAVLSDLAASFADQPGRPEVQLSLAPSAVIREQIEKGSSGLDIFVAASPGEIEKLSAGQFTRDDTVRTLAENEIVFASAWAADNPNAPWDMLAMHAWERIALANPEKTMSGVAARGLLEGLGLAEELRHKIYYENDSNRVLEKIKRAQVSAGIIYRSDVTQLKPRETFRVYDLPRTNQPPILYCAVVLRESKLQEPSAAFVNFLHSPSNQAAWARWGFSPVGQFGEVSAAPESIPDGPEVPRAAPVAPKAEAPAAKPIDPTLPPIGIRRQGQE